MLHNQPNGQQADVVVQHDDESSYTARTSQARTSQARTSQNGGGGGGGGKRATPNKRSKSIKKQEANRNHNKNNKKISSNQDNDAHASKQALILILFLIGLIVCVSSILALLMLPHFVSQQIAKKLVLKNNSMLLERWSKPNVPMYFKVWLFNVVNAQEVSERRDAKPRVEEIGPFVFNLKRQKDVVSFAGENLYYTERRIYHFNRELSCCAINTTVTIPNIPLVAVVDRALGYNLPLVGRFIPRLINRAIGSLREQLFVRKQVREILFDGYEVELLRMVSRIGSLVGLPQQSQKFALLKGRNDTWRPEQDGVWAINTGQKDRKQFGRVSSWNSYKRLPFWPAAACNVINGSDGTLFPPPIQRTQPLYIFNQELCRTVNLVYDGPSNIRSIHAYRFVLNPLNFAHTMSPAGGAATAPNSATPPAARINPTFQNPTRVAPPTAGAGQPSAAAAPKPHHQVKPVSVAAAAPARGGADLKPSASSSVGARADAVTPTSSPPPRPSISNLHQDNAKSTPTASEEETQNQQERLIKIAQEAQLAQERRQESRINPQTCFCDRKTTNLNGVNVCEFDGLIDLSRCSKQAQVIFGSMPHFHQSDARLLRQVNGLTPNASKHTTYLDIEPNTGLVLGGKRRVQLNLIIKHNNEIDGFENINDMLVPIVWFEESAMIPEESAQKFRSLYIERVRLVNWSLISLLIASIVLLIIDARLLVTTHYWRQFKVSNFHQHQSSSTAPNIVMQSQQPEVLVAKSALSVLAKKLTTSGGHYKNDSRQLATSSNEMMINTRPLLSHAPSSSSSSSFYTTNSTTGSSTTRVAHSTSSSSSSSSTISSCTTSASSTPTGSPELRKWAGPTRVHLNGAGATTPETFHHESTSSSAERNDDDR